MKKIKVYFVGSMAVSQSGEMRCISTIYSAFLRENEARTKATMENERGDVFVEGRRYQQRTIVFPVEVTFEKTISDVYVVWSNAFCKDGSGGIFIKLEGAFIDEEKAQEAYQRIPSQCEIKGIPCDLKKKIKLLQVE